jgi:excisionase family DNA binding protein
MVQEVLIHLNEERPLLTMTIHWTGGVHTQIQFKKPTKGYNSKKTDENIVDLLEKLSPRFPDEEIARILNCHKLKTGQENSWTRTRVRSLRSSHKIAPFDRTKKTDVMTMNEAARYLNVNAGTIRTLIRNGIVKAEQIIKHEPYEIERTELDKEIVKLSIERLKEGQSLKYFEGVSPQQISFYQ